MALEPVLKKVASMGPGTHRKDWPEKWRTPIVDQRREDRAGCHTEGWRTSHLIVPVSQYCGNETGKGRQCRLAMEDKRWTGIGERFSSTNNIEDR